MGVRVARGAPDCGAAPCTAAACPPRALHVRYGMRWCAAQGWAPFTSGAFHLVKMPNAGHLWPAGGDKESKAAWLAHIVRELERGSGG